MPPDKSVQTAAFVPGALKCLGNLSFHGSENKFADAIQQFLFSRDVIVKRRLMNVQAGGDFAGCGLGESFFTE
jgi:hypothetical protein